jgi:hypothetical protein
LSARKKGFGGLKPHFKGENAAELENCPPPKPQAYFFFFIFIDLEHFSIFLSCFLSALSSEDSSF